MKKTSTILVNGNMIFKGHKLTIGLDLGDRWSFLLRFGGSGPSHFGTETTDDTGSDEADI